MNTHHHHEYVYHMTRLTEMKKLFWEKTFSSFAVGLVGLLTPVYLLRLNYSLQQVFMFYALAGLTLTLFTPLCFKLMGVLGTNRTMVVGNFFLVLFFTFLYLLPSWHEPLWWLAVARGLNSTFYFPAFNTNFVLSRSHTRTGSQIGRLNAIILTFNGLAPAVGGILAVTFDLPAVFIAAVCLVVVANVPLLLPDGQIKPKGLKFSAIPWASYKDFLANGLYNVTTYVEMIIWPMVISLFIASYAGIGILGSVVVISSIAISLYVGKHEDVVGEEKFLKGGVTAGFIGSSLRPLAYGPITILAVNMISGTGSALLANSFASRYYKNADSNQMIEYIFGMEITRAIVWVLYFGLLTILATWLSTALVLVLAMLLAVPCVFGVRLIKV